MILLLILTASLAAITTRIDKFSGVDIGEDDNEVPDDGNDEEDKNNPDDGNDEEDKNNPDDGGDEEDSGSKNGGLTSSPVKLDKINPEGGSGSCKKLFYISQNDDTAYIKNVVGIEYDGVYFELGDEEQRAYDGGNIEPDVKDYENEESDDIIIEPIVKFNPGFIPVSLHTTEVEVSKEGMTDLDYYKGQNIFASDSTFMGKYEFKTTHYRYSEAALESSRCVDETKYLQLPDVITDRTRDLSNQITKGIESPYRKAVEIKKYLMKHYTYEKNYSRAPEGHEPIDWFLFEEKKGVCANFNCAFAILCRISDVPTRVVSGFRVKSNYEKKPVTGCQSHCWMELGLDVGWITMDATPGSDGGSNGNGEPGKKLIDTDTEITNVSSNDILKTDNFTVKGVVENETGINVDGMHVFVYLKKNKSSSSEGVRCGRGFVKDSKFKVRCSVPKDIRVGDYHLIAHAVTNNIYNGSRSDPEIRILSETKISLRYPGKSYRNNTLEIQGKLTETGGFNLSNKSLKFYMNGERKGNITTNERGNFSFDRSFKRIGSYSFKFEFEGEEYYLSSSNDCEIEIKRIALDSFEDMVINDGDTRLEGRLMIDSIPVSEEDISLKIDDQDFIQNETNSDGSFSYRLDEDTKNGRHEFKIHIPKTDRTIEDSVLIKTKTDLKMSITEKTKDMISLKLFLKDFNDNGLEDQKIFFNNSILDKGMSLNTNEKGSTNITIDLPERLESEKITLSCRYNGSENYSRSGIYREIDLAYIQPPGQNTSSPKEQDDLDRSIIGLLIVMVVGLASLGFAWKRGYISSLISKFELKKEVYNAEKSEQSILDELEIIDFPEISDDLPLVWGVGDEIKINLDSDHENIKLLIDGEEKDVGQEKDRYTYTGEFVKKGEHKINAILNEYTETRSLRIVEYREEIQREYTQLLDLLKKYNISIDKRTTPMEVESKLLDRYGEHKRIKIIRKFFEKSKYSYHEIEREDYVRFMKAKIRMVNGIEKID